MKPIIKTPPSASPVTLAEAKEHLRVDIDDEDTLIQSLIDAVVSHLDGWGGVLGRCLLTQTWEIRLRSWPTCIRLPFPDVSAVEIRYVDTSGVEQTVSGALYEITQAPAGAVVEFKDDWTAPSYETDMAEPITVDVTAGYGAAGDVPAAIRQAILLLVGHYYENRMAVTEETLQVAPLAFKALLTPYRCEPV